MKRFEVGKAYEPNDTGYDPIQVLRRTEKMILVRNRTSQWRMRIRVDYDGVEYVTDSTVPVGWREAFTYSARHETERGYAN